MLHRNTPSASKDLSEYGESFLSFVQEQNLQDVNMDRILDVCIGIEKNHHGRQRLTGDYKHYHSHLYEVARLYIELGGKNITEEGIIIALRHDDIEDLDGKNGTPNINFSDIKEENGGIVALCIQALSKPKSVDKSEESKRERDQEYYPNFHDLTKLKAFILELANMNEVSLNDTKAEELAHLVAVIRINDRIHNLKTMPDEYPAEKRKRKVDQTEKDLVSLAQSLGLSELRDKLIKALIHSHRIDKKIETGKALRTH